MHTPREENDNAERRTPIQRRKQDQAESFDYTDGTSKSRQNSSAIRHFNLRADRENREKRGTDRRRAPCSGGIIRQLIDECSDQLAFTQAESGRLKKREGVLAKRIEQLETMLKELGEEPD
jgi:hypothetical protein